MLLFSVFSDHLTMFRIGNSSLATSIGYVIYPLADDSIVPFDCIKKSLPVV